MACGVGRASGVSHRSEARHEGPHKFMPFMMGDMYMHVHRQGSRSVVGGVPVSARRNETRRE